MIKSSITISNKLGLHARASAKLTKLAGSFASEVFLSRNGRRVNAKSIMGVMMLAAGMGSEIEIEVEGADEAGSDGRVARADRRQVRRRPVSRFTTGTQRVMSIQVFGMPVSRGVAIGRAVLVASSRVDVAHYFVACRAAGARDRAAARGARRRCRRADRR